jgi:predicted DNA-binding transcriptional regulator AlpA
MNQNLEPASYSVAAFCAAHNICRASFYKLLKAGRAPSFIRVGRKILISREAAQAWRNQGAAA